MLVTAVALTITHILISEKVSCSHAPSCYVTYVEQAQGNGANAERIWRVNAKERKVQVVGVGGAFYNHHSSQLKHY